WILGRRCHRRVEKPVGRISAIGSVVRNRQPLTAGTIVNERAEAIVVDRLSRAREVGRRYSCDRTELSVEAQCPSIQLLAWRSLRHFARELSARAKSACADAGRISRISEGRSSLGGCDVIDVAGSQVLEERPEAP